MVTQVAVPGTQIVTLAISMLRVEVGVAPTVTARTLGVFDCATALPGALAVGVLAGLAALAATGALAGVDAPVAAEAEPPLPPPQAVSAAQSAKAAKRARPAARDGGGVRAFIARLLR
jgi:hypothetical protein